MTLLGVLALALRVSAIAGTPPASVGAHPALAPVVERGSPMEVPPVAPSTAVPGAKHRRIPSSSLRPDRTVAVAAAGPDVRAARPCGRLDRPLCARSISRSAVAHAQRPPPPA